MALVILLFAGAAALALLASDSSIFGLPPGQAAYVTVYGAIAVMLLASLVTRFRGRFGQALRYLSIWGLLFIALLTAHAYRGELAGVADRVKEEFVPGSVVASVPGEASVSRRLDGQFVMNATANGVKVPFVFDTGASSVVIRAEDAGRMGIPVDRLAYRVPVSTANGRTLAAETTIDTLSIGGITQSRIRALVAKPGALAMNLLGQTFLERLSSYRVENNRLIMRAGAD